MVQKAVRSVVERRSDAKFDERARLASILSASARPHSAGAPLYAIYTRRAPLIYTLSRNVAAYRHRNAVSREFELAKKCAACKLAFRQPLVSDENRRVKKMNVFIFKYAVDLVFIV